MRWRPSTSRVARLVTVLTAGAVLSAAPLAGAAPLQAHAQGHAVVRAQPDVAPEVDEQGRQITRIDEADRYAAAIAVTQRAFPGPRSPKVVVLTTGESAPHAIAAGPAAVAMGGISLITPPQGLTPDLLAELQRLAPHRIVIAGDTSIVSAQVGQAAARIASTVRIGGSTAADVSRILASHAFGPTSASEAWVASADDSPDLLAAASAAAANRAPFILVPPDATTIGPRTAGLLRDLGVREAFLVGDTDSLASGVEESLEGTLRAVQRVAGETPAATSAQIAELVFGDPASGPAFLASGVDSSPALVGSAYAGMLGRPLLISDTLCVPEPAREILSQGTFISLTIFGGEGTLRGLAATLEPCQSLHDPASPWVVVNKVRPVTPEGFSPSDLTTAAAPRASGYQVRAEVADAIDAMFAAAAEEGAGRLSLESGFRSYASQQSVYGGRLSDRGRAYADQWIARPGHSEHQLGLAVDVGPVGAPGCADMRCIGRTAQGQWLAENSWRFGFIVRYQEGNRDWTGYNPEPWHLRYVGVPLATDYHQGGWTSFEEYVGLPAAPDYSSSP